jgi:Homeodomain-like domain
MTELMLADHDLMLAPIHALPRAPWRLSHKKKFFYNRKNIVDSAPLHVYVCFTLPNCEDGLRPRATLQSRGLIHAAALRSSIMMAQEEARRAAARKLYEIEQRPVSQIASELGVSRATITRWSRLGHWQRASSTGKNHETIDRRALVTRAWRNAERQLRLIEKRVKAHAPDDAPLDESARLIATLVKTLRELTALDRSLAEDDSIHARDNAAEGGDIPRDVDTFYQELAARMDRLRQDRDSGGPAR